MRDKYNRLQAIINSATENDIVNLLMVINYRDLYLLLVKSDSDNEVFLDTFLNLTHTYQPSIDFMNEFCRLFRMIKTRYQLTDNEYNYKIISLNAISEKSTAELD